MNVTGWLRPRGTNSKGRVSGHEGRTSSLAANIMCRVGKPTRGVSVERRKCTVRARPRSVADALFSAAAACSAIEAASAGR